MTVSELRDLFVAEKSQILAQLALANRNQVDPDPAFAADLAAAAEIETDPWIAQRLLVASGWFRRNTSADGGTY